MLCSIPIISPQYQVPTLNSVSDDRSSLKTMWSPKSTGPLHCPWKPCDSPQNPPPPPSVTPENNAIPQNPPPPFITPKNHMTPTKSSASILRSRWKPCDPLKSSVPPLSLEISPKAVGRTIFPLSNLTEEWGGVYVLFTLEHMLEFWVNRTRISTHTLWPSLTFRLRSIKYSGHWR